MNDWRVSLQLEAYHGPSSCVLYAMAGVTQPARISIVACDPGAISSAAAVHSEIDRRLAAMGGTGTQCSGGGGLGMNCQTWGEPSCQHVLVLMITSVPLDNQYEIMAKEWLRQRPGRVLILPALAPGLQHSQVFPAGAYPTLRECTAAPWAGSYQQLAHSAMSAALLDEKPGVFLSYLRREASAAAEDVHDGLVREGYRVFLDRFQGTPGRVFPHELSEAMADMGLVLLFETANLWNSDWTMFEAKFARRYRLGPIALNFRGAPEFRSVASRLKFPSEDPLATLSSRARDDILEFVRNRYLRAAVVRRAYYETLARQAAQSKGGDVMHVSRGLLSVSNASGSIRGYALPSASPGRLRHVRRLSDFQPPSPRILAGQHYHLPPTDRDDLRWLARHTNITLAGPGSMYNAVRSIV